MPIILETHGILDKILHTYLLQYCPATGMHIGDNVMLSIILGGQGLLVKMLITLDPRGIFLIKFCILIHFNIIRKENGE